MRPRLTVALGHGRQDRPGRNLGQPCRCSDSRAVVLRRHLDKQPPANAEPPGAEPCPFLITAHRIFHENGVARWQLEAYVLSDMSDREVAVRCDVPREVVAAYVAVFFDVRPHLPPGKWIMQHVIGPSPYSGFREHDVRPFWALMATSCGPKFVEMFVKAYLAALRPDDRPVLSVYFGPNVPLAVQGPVALQILGMTGEGDLVNEKLHRRLDVAESLADPELAEAEAKQAVGDVIQTARAILAGKRIPKQGKSALTEEGNVVGSNGPIGSTNPLQMAEEISYRSCSSLTDRQLR